MCNYTIFNEHLNNICITRLNKSYVIETNVVIKTYQMGNKCLLHETNSKQASSTQLLTLTVFYSQQVTVP